MHHGKKASKFKLHVRVAGEQASYEGLRVIWIGSVRKSFQHDMTVQL